MGIIKYKVSSGQWQQLHLGVYAIFTGAPGRTAQLWGPCGRTGARAGMLRDFASGLAFHYGVM